jgi:hypothetical protein
MSFRKFLNENQLLLEYDAEKTWSQHGKKVTKAVDSAFHDQGDEHPVVWNATHEPLPDGGGIPFESHESPEANAAARTHLLPRFEHADPTPQKKYVQHIARIYGNGGIPRFEDIHARMRPALSKFDDLAKRKILPAEHRDIGKIKSLGELEDLVDAHADKLSGRETDRAESEAMKGEATIKDHPEFTQITPHTTRAACHYGKGTRWCTATEDPEDSMFPHYNNVGPMHILVPKKPSYPGQKYQYHYSSHQFMNERDDPVSRSDYPTYGNRADGHPAINKFVDDYETKMEEDSKSKKALDHPETRVRDMYIRHHASEDEINKIIKSGNRDMINMASLNPSFDSNKAPGMILKHNQDRTARQWAAGNGYASHEDLMNAVNDKDPVVAQAALKNENAESDHLMAGLKHAAASVRETVLRAPNVAPEHVDAAADSDDVRLRRIAAGHSQASEHTLLKLAHDPDTSTAFSVQANKAATDKVREKAFDYPHMIDKENPFAVHPLTGMIDNIHNSLDPEAMKMKVLEHPNATSDMKHNMLAHRWASPQVLYKALDDPSKSVQTAAASNQGASSGVIDKAMDMGHYSSVVRRFNAPLEDHHIDRIVNEAPHAWKGMVSGAMGNVTDNVHKLQPHHIDKMLEDGVHGEWNYTGSNPTPKRDDSLTSFANNLRDYHSHTHLVMHSRNASSENIHKAIDHENPLVGRVAIMSNPNVESEHLQHAIQKHDRGIAGAVTSHAKLDSATISLGLQHPDHAIRHSMYTNAKNRNLLGPEHRELADKHIKDWNEGYGRIHGKIKEEKMSFKNFISESTQLLLEYNQDITWQQHGKKVADRALHMYFNDHDEHPALENNSFIKIRGKSHGALSRSSEERQANSREHILPHLENADPTPQKKYVQHIARIFGNGGVNRFEDLESRMKPALEKFHDLSTRRILPPEHRDIGRIKSLESLENLVDAHSDQKSGKEISSGKHNAMKGEATITDHPEFTQITPHTANAANHFGQGTRWCTTGTNGAHMFNHYNSQGPLHILVPKNPSYNGEKYQYHFASGQFMDEKDSRAASNGDWDPVMYRASIGNALPKTNSHIHSWIADYEANADSSVHKREGLSHPEPKVARQALSHAKDITKDDLTVAMKGGAAADAIKHPFADQSHVNQAFKGNNNDAMAGAIKHHPDKITKEHLTRAMSMGGNAALEGVSHPLVDHDHIVQALQKGGKAGEQALKNPALSREQITTALKSEDKNIRRSVLQNPAITSDDLHSALKKDSETAHAALSHPGITTQHIETAMNHSDAGVKIAALNHEKTTDEIRSNALNSKNPRTRALMVRNGGDGMAEKGIKDPHELVRWASVYAKDGEKVLDKAINDPHPDVRLAAVSHREAPSHVLEKGAFDSDPIVAAAARGHRRAVYRGEHSFIEPKYPVRATKWNSSASVRGQSYSYTHAIGNKLSDDKVEAVKRFAKNHNKTSSYKLKILRRNRAGVGNPAMKSLDARNKQRYGNVDTKNASRQDMYLYHPYHPLGGANKNTPDHIKNQHPILEDNQGFDYICNKSEESGVGLDVLIEVYNRGVNEWNDDTGKTKDQYAFNRLNSFLSGGFARKLDDDLLTEISRETLNNYVRKARVVVDNTPEDWKSHKKAKKGISRAEKKLMSEDSINEVSATLANKYVRKAQKSVHDMETGPYSNEKDDKTFKRKMYINFAKFYKMKRIKEDSNNVVDNSEIELIEKKNLVLTEPAKYAAVKRRDTKLRQVRSYHTEKEKHLYDHHRTEMALKIGFRVKHGDKGHHFTDRGRHQLTDRWRDQNRSRINRFRKPKLTESQEYIEARRKLHDAHSEASRQMAGMERDPELRRIDLHRAKKHATASRVLEILKARAKKKSETTS